MLKVMNRGDANRVTAATDMNDRSSRSHAVFVINLTQTDIVKQTRRSSKLFLVDLAGSEQVSRSGASGLTLEQAKKINKSLSALSLVIQSLVEKKHGSHIPYRDSKLTRLLTDSLGGNAKTVLLLAMSPSYDSLGETYSTLGFGSRAKKMQNNAKVNEEMTIGTYKKLVSVMGKDLDVWKRKYEDADKKYSDLLENYQKLENECLKLKTTSDATADLEIARWKAEMGLMLASSVEELEKKKGVEEVKELEEVDEGEDEVVVDEILTVGERGGDVTRRSSTECSSTTMLNLDELCMFHVGNMVVFDADAMFTFESF
jgi:hypothetical protein